MESIIASYKTKSKDAKRIAGRLEELISLHKMTGITPPVMFAIISCITSEVYNIRRLTKDSKKSLVIDLVYCLIEQINDGEKDSELEKSLKRVVPELVDTIVPMIKIKKRCGCF